MPTQNKRLESRLQIAEALDELGWNPSMWPNYTFRNLCDCVENDSAILERRDRYLHMILDIAVAYVRFNLAGRMVWEVREILQYFRKSGKILRRPNFDGIGETMKRQESVGLAVDRLLKEELGFPSHGYEIEPLEEQILGPLDSLKWPGGLVQVTFRRHRFICRAHTGLFRPVYIESQTRKIIVFAPVPTLASRT